MNSHDKRFYILDAYACNLNFDGNLFRQINEKYVPFTIVYTKNICGMLKHRRGLLMI